MHGAAGAYAHYLKRGLLFFLGSSGEIDVLERVQLVHDDINIVGTYAGGYARDTLAVVAAGDGMELTRLDVALYGAFIEERGNHVDAVLVADKDDLVCQMFGTDMQMEDATIIVDDKL